MNSKSEIQIESDALSVHRARMLLPLSIVGFCCFLPFFIFNLAQGHYFLSVAVLAQTLVFFFNGYAIYHQKKIPIPFEILLVPAAIIIVILIINQGAYGAFWCYPLLMFFYFVLSRRTANVFGIVLLVVITGIILQSFGKELTLRFAASFGLLLVMANIIVGRIDSLHQDLLEQTTRDPLTGAFNRRYMETRLADAIVQKQRKQTLATVLALDIDFFKSVNDELGHAAGDEVLKGIVNIIIGRARQLDKLFRVGGEEFLLFLPETSEANAALVAEHLRRLINEAVLLDDRRVTVSIGVSELQAGESLEVWLKYADNALYKAKQSGRNRVVLRNPL